MSGHIEEEIKGKILPEVQQRIAAAIGQEVPIKVDWASFSASPNATRALQALYSFAGYFVFERLATVIERLVKEGGSELLRNKFKTIEISNINTDEEVKKVFYNAGVLHLRGRYHLGAFNGFERFELRRQLEQLSAFRGRAYKKEWYDRTVPEFDKRMKESLKTTIPIEVEWPTFDSSPNGDEAIYRLATWYGSYSTWPIYYALDSLKRKDDLSSEDVLDTVKKVVISNIPGEEYWKKHAYVKDGILYYYGCFEDYWYGTLSWYQFEQIIYEAILFARLKPFNNLNEEKQKKKIEFLEKVATDPNIVNGHLDYLKQVAAHPAFWQPDAKDKDGMMKCLTQYHELMAKAEKEEKKGEEAAASGEAAPLGGETFIQGWRVTKINYRGQEQNRLVVLTDQALYTFKYDYVKEVANPKHAHRYEHTDYDYCRFVELKAAKGSGALGAAAAVANAVMGKPRWGFRLVTNIKNKKPMPIPAAVKDKIKEKVFEILKKLVEENVCGKEDMPELRLPGIPAYTASSLLEIANNSLATATNLPIINLTNAPPAGLCDVLAILKESMDELAKQPKIKLTNVPSLSLGDILLKVLDVLSKIDLDISLPEYIHIATFVRNFITILKAAKEAGGFDLPAPTPLPLTDLLQSIKTAITTEKELEIPPVDLPKFPSLPTVPQIIDQVCEQLQKAEIEAIKFPAFPQLNIIGTLEKIADALSGISGLPSIKMPELPGLPSINLPGGELIKMIKGPSAPTWVEFVCEPCLKEDDKDFAKIISQEMCWFMYGCVRAATRPYYQSQPWESSHTIESSPLYAAYNAAKMGKDNKPAE